MFYLDLYHKKINQLILNLTRPFLRYIIKKSMNRPAIRYDRLYKNCEKYTS